MGPLFSPIARIYDAASLLFAKVLSAAPSSGDAGLVVREVDRRARLVDGSDATLLAAPAGAAPASSLVVAGADSGALTRRILTDTLGTVMTMENQLSKAQTYSAYKHNLVAASPATDVFTITGSASKIIRVLEVRVSGYQTNNSVINLHVIKRSTANSGGTATAQTATPHDSNNSAATATVQAYSVNPTLGTAVGTGIVDAWFSLNKSNDANTAEQVFCFNQHGGQLPTLRGTNEVLAVNLVNQSLAGNNWCMVFTWTESDT